MLIDKNKVKPKKLFQLFVLSNHYNSSFSCKNEKETFYCISWKFYTENIEK